MTSIDSMSFRLGARQAGFRIVGARITNRRGEGGLIAGARADTDTAGQVDRRVTVTRLVALGPFAVAAKKKKDNREFYVTISGADGWQIVGKADPKAGAAVRRWVAEFNTLASRAVPRSNVVTDDCPDLPCMKRWREQQGN